MVPTCLPSLAPPYDGVTTSSAVAAAAKMGICWPYTHDPNTFVWGGGGGGGCTFPSLTLVIVSGREMEWSSLHCIWSRISHCGTPGRPHSLHHGQEL